MGLRLSSWNLSPVEILHDKDNSWGKEELSLLG